MREGPGDGWRALFGEEGSEIMRCRRRVSSGGGVVDSSGDTERKEFEFEGVGARWLSRSVSEPESVSLWRDEDACALGVKKGDRDKCDRREELAGDGVLSREKEESLSMA